MKNAIKKLLPLNQISLLKYIKQANNALIVPAQEQVTQSDKEKKHVTFNPERNPGSRKEDLTTLNINQEKKNDNTGDGTNRENERIPSFSKEPIITDTNQKEITKQADKNLTLEDTTGSKLKEPKDTRSVQAVSRKKGDKVSGKITWGINFSAGSSVITEDAFSFKSSGTTADKQYTSPGSITGGPLNGGGGPVTYPESESKPAFAFKVGINGRKNISKRSSLLLGLAYSYLCR